MIPVTVIQDIDVYKYKEEKYSKYMYIFLAHIVTPIIGLIIGPVGTQGSNSPRLAR